MTRPLGAVLLLLLAAGCAKPADDFRMICEKANAAANASGDKRSQFATEVTQGLKTREGENAFRAAGAAADAEKEAILRRGAAEVGLSDWKCPALSALYGPQQVGP